MSVKRPVDVIDYRGERAKKILTVFCNIKFDFFIKGNKEYELGPFEMIRLVNIFATSNDIKRSLNGFANLLKKRDENYESITWWKEERK